MPIKLHPSFAAHPGAWLRAEDGGKRNGNFRPSAYQPRKCSYDNSAAILFDRGAVGHEYFFGGPTQYSSHRFTGDASVKESDSKFPRYRRLGRSQEVQSRHQCAPAREPPAIEVLEQIGEDHRSAAVVEENNFGRDPVSPDDHLIDISRPMRSGSIGEVAIQQDVRASRTQPRRRVEYSGRICAAPLIDKSMVERIRCNNVMDRPKQVDSRVKLAGKCDGRPYEERAIGQSDYGHACGILEACHEQRWAACYPYLVTKMLQHLLPGTFTGGAGRIADTLYLRLQGSYNAV